MSINATWIWDTSIPNNLLNGNIIIRPWNYKWFLCSYFMSLRAQQERSSCKWWHYQVTVSNKQFKCTFPGREVQEGEDIGIPLADSRWYLAETNTVLESNYTSIKNK